MRGKALAGAAAFLGLVSAQADAQVKSFYSRHTGAHCVPVSAATAADITWGTNGRLTNNGTVNRTVICDVEMPVTFISTNDMGVGVQLTQSANCVLRVSDQFGNVLQSASKTGDPLNFQLFGSDAQPNVAANLRCSIPPGASLIWYDVATTTGV
jgi:hypothetical protein